MLRQSMDASSANEDVGKDKDVESERSGSPEPETVRTSLIPQRKIASLLLGLGSTRSLSLSKGQSTETYSSQSSLGSVKEPQLPAEGNSGEPEAAQPVVPLFPPLSNPFVDKSRTSLLTREQELRVMAAIREKIDRDKADGVFSDGANGNSTGLPLSSFGAYTFHSRTPGQISNEAAERSAPTLEVSEATGQLDSDSPRPTASPSIRSRPKSDTESLKSPSPVGARTSDSKVAENILLPFQRLDNSLKLWLRLKALGPAETPLAWVPGSYFLQIAPTEAEALAMQNEQNGASRGKNAGFSEVAGYFLATSTSLRIYDATFEMPYREAFFDDATYRNPARYVKLHEEISLTAILRIDVSLSGETIVVRSKKVAQGSSKDNNEPTSYVMHMRDSRRAAAFLSSLRTVLPGDAKSPVWNDGGWWTGLNAVYDLEFSTEKLALYSTAGFIDAENALMTTCAVLSDGTTLAVALERWQVWPPLLFPPERLGDKRQWVNDRVGKVPKKGLLADIVGQFRPLVFAAKLTDFERAEKWSVRRTEVPVFDSWMLQGGLMGSRTSNKPTKAKPGAATADEIQGSAAGWGWVVKLFFRTPSTTAEEDDKAAELVSLALFVATMGAADRFLGMVAGSVGIRWSVPEDQAEQLGSMLAFPRGPGNEGVMFSSSTKL
jgi:hypothetical protein